MTSLEQVSESTQSIASRNSCKPATGPDVISFLHPIFNSGGLIKCQLSLLVRFRLNHFFFFNSRVALQMMLTGRIDLTSGRDLHAPHVLLFLFSIFFGLMPFTFLESLLPFTLPISFSFTIKKQCAIASK